MPFKMFGVKNTGKKNDKKRTPRQLTDREKREQQELTEASRDYFIDTLLDGVTDVRTRKYIKDIGMGIPVEQLAGLHNLATDDNVNANIVFEQTRDGKVKARIVTLKTADNVGLPEIVSKLDRSFTGYQSTAPRDEEVRALMGTTNPDGGTNLIAYDIPLDVNIQPATPEESTTPNVQPDPNADSTDVVKSVPIEITPPKLEKLRQFTPADFGYDDSDDEAESLRLPQRYIDEYMKAQMGRERDYQIANPRTGDALTDTITGALSGFGEGLLQEVYKNVTGDIDKRNYLEKVIRQLDQMYGTNTVDEQGNLVQGQDYDIATQRAYQEGMARDARNRQAIQQATQANINQDRYADQRQQQDWQNQLQARQVRDRLMTSDLQRRVMQLGLNKKEGELNPSGVTTNPNDTVTSITDLKLRLANQK
jgi:hypothetical protein